MIKMKKYTHYICKSYSTLPVDPIEYFVQINIHPKIVALNLNFSNMRNFQFCITFKGSIFVHFKNLFPDTGIVSFTL